MTAATYANDPSTIFKPRYGNYIGGCNVINERMSGMIIENNAIMIFSDCRGVFDFKTILTLFLICGFMKNIEFESHIA